MERELNLAEISDGKRYMGNDLVKVGCRDCMGCSKCCYDMGNSIILDPWDVFHIQKGTNQYFSELLEEKIELQVVEGLILPNIKMQESTGGCGFLSESERCLIHDSRPGFCRMFPLGRIYENHSFQYFLQVQECPYPDKTKMKVKKWLGVPELSIYERYINIWHDFLNEMKALLPELREDEAKTLNMYLIKQFFIEPYHVHEDFYLQFQSRYKTVRETLQIV